MTSKLSQIRLSAEGEAAVCSNVFQREKIFAGQPSRRPLLTSSITLGKSHPQSTGGRLEQTQECRLILRTSMPQSHAPGQLSLPALRASSSPLPSDVHLLSACSFFFFKVVTISLEILHLPQPLPPHQAACAVSTALDSSSLHKR